MTNALIVDVVKHLKVAFSQEKEGEEATLSNFGLCPSRRCFTKTNGTFGSSALPVVPLGAPFQQDGVEMKPLSPHIMVAMCLASATPKCSARLEEDGGESAEQPPAQHPCCREGMSQLSVDCMDGEASSLTWLGSWEYSVGCL